MVASKRLLNRLRRSPRLLSPLGGRSLSEGGQVPVAKTSSAPRIPAGAIFLAGVVCSSARVVNCRQSVGPMQPFSHIVRVGLQMVLSDIA
jgi:hypothetical protein